MVNFFSAIVATFLVLVSQNILAQNDSAWVIDAQATRYFSENTSEQQSLLGIEMFVRRTFGDQGTGIYAFGYHDEQFWGAYFGVSKIIGNFEIGLGAGPASYSGNHWAVINPWLYYASDFYEGSVHLEYIAEETSSAEWFYKYHFQRSFGDRWSAGIYGEKNLGIGPMLGLDLANHLNVWASIPIAGKLDEGAMQWLLALSVTFE